MEARQKAQEFIKNCRFRKTQKSKTMLEACADDFNDTVLANFLKQYVSEVSEKFFSDNEFTNKERMDIWRWRDWWGRNNITL